MITATANMTPSINRYWVSATVSDWYGGTKKMPKARTDKKDAKIPEPRPNRTATSTTASRYTMTMLAKSSKSRTGKASKVAIKQATNAHFKPARRPEIGRAHA